MAIMRGEEATWSRALHGRAMERWKGIGNGLERLRKLWKLRKLWESENLEMAKPQVPQIPKTPSDENPENEEDVLHPGRRVWLSVGHCFSDMNGMECQHMPALIFWWRKARHKSLRDKERPKQNSVLVRFWCKGLAYVGVKHAKKNVSHRMPVVSSSALSK